jgi:glycosyltransferase involved in cell wall biosynthesis
MQPLVTIAIPTYNRANSFLKASLNSAINQTYQNIEIIVSDNCSTDNTESVVKSFNDRRIRYFRQKENIGAIPNTNYCLHQAKGVYFTQLHDDNLIDNDFIEICLKSVNYSSDIGIIRTGTRIIDSEDNVLREYPNMAKGLSPGAYFRAYFSGATASYLCSILFNTKRVREIGGFHSKYNILEDVMAEIKIGIKYGRYDIQEIKASFRRHDSALTLAGKVRDWCEESLILIDLMCELAPENQTHIRGEGKRAMSSFNYQLASKIKSPRERFNAYLYVFKAYKYTQFPPCINKLIYQNIFFRGARYLARRLGMDPAF